MQFPAHVAWGLPIRSRQLRLRILWRQRDGFWTPGKGRQVSHFVESGWCREGEQPSEIGYAKYGCPFCGGTMFFFVV